MLGKALGTEIIRRHRHGILPNTDVILKNIYRDEILIKVMHIFPESSLYWRVDGLQEKENSPFLQKKEQDHYFHVFPFNIGSLHLNHYTYVFCKTTLALWCLLKGLASGEKQIDTSIVEKRIRGFATNLQKTLRKYRRRKKCKCS